MQTIFALATARGKSGVAVVRISGPEAFSIAEALAGPVPQAGQFAYRAIRDKTGAVLDHGLVLSFRSPRSFTGEDTIELQVHGSIAVITAIERAIVDTGLARAAEAGEFTRRALMNDRMDLGQVEALGDLIEAETEQQRLAANAMLGGALRELADTLRKGLLHALALVEVTIDFADEDVPVDIAPEVAERLEYILERIQVEVAGSHVSERLRDGFEVAIVGRPNSGKSTLLNRIAGREVAIISELAGTTRDILEVRIDLQGLPVTFLDTAGVRDGGDVVEQEGIRRARIRATEADLRVFLGEAGGEGLQIDRKAGDLVLSPKADLRNDGKGVSGVTGQGVDHMLEHIGRELSVRLAHAGTANRDRHRVALENAAQQIQGAVGRVRSEQDEAELIANDIRGAVRSLDMLVGAIDVEEVLGEIFSQFCIGK